MKTKNTHISMKTIPLLVLTFGFASATSTFAQGCCAAGTAHHACCDMAGHDADVGNAIHASPQSAALSQPVATVFDSYIRVETALAKDSLDDVAKNARTIAKAVKDDPTTTFSANVPRQAETLAKAADLRAARDAFKPLSQSLIEYVSKYPALAASFRQAYCPMAKASWLQTGTTILNPYMGNAMVHCGEFVKSANSSGSAPQHGDHSMHM